MSFDSSVDVVVVGAGPGGSTAATFIAMAGHSVLLLEKHRYPLYKIGESLLPATVHGICPMLGVSDALIKANFVVKRGGTFLWGQDREPWTFLFSTSAETTAQTSTAYQVDRMTFDNILLANAKEKGVCVEEDCSVLDAIVEAGRVVGVEYLSADNSRRTVRARYVVDASGYQSVLARHAGERIYSQFFQNVALFTYYRGGKRLPPPHEGNIYSAAFDYGWFWYIPLNKDLTSVGAVISQDKMSILANGYDRAIELLINFCPTIKELLLTATRETEGEYGKVRLRKDYSYSNARFWTPGLALVGDAACFIDPVFSSGVHLATYSALLVARSINTALAGTIDENRCFSEFESRYRREFALFHDFLIAFYDANKHIGSEFWKTRNINSSTEISNEMFVSLIAGVGGSGEPLYPSPDEYLKTREGLGEALFGSIQGIAPTDKRLKARREAFYSKFTKELTQLQVQAMFREERPGEVPLFVGGLIPSRDALHWVDPK